MKSNIFIEVFDENIIEVNDTYENTIYKLRRIHGGGLREMPSMFYCTKTGWFNLGEISQGYENSKPIAIHGKVIESDGKTYLKYRTVHYKFMYPLGIFGALIAAVYVLLAVLWGVLETKLTVKILLFSAAPILVAASFIAMAFYKPKITLADFDVLKKGVEKVVDAVNRWDE